MYELYFSPLSIKVISMGATMPLDNNNDGHYNLWDFCPETYDCFRAYYNLYSNEDNVLVYEQAGVCDSDVNKEEDME
jgi:hypothetical protein